MPENSTISRIIISKFEKKTVSLNLAQMFEFRFLTPVVGALAAAIGLGEPLGIKEMLAMTLTLSGITFALSTSRSRQPVLVAIGMSELGRCASVAWYKKRLLARAFGTIWLELNRDDPSQK